MPVTVNTAAKPSWLMGGSQSKAALQQTLHAQQEAKEAAARMRRFYLNVGEEKQVTFLDGDMDGDGLLEFLSFHEHRVQTGPKNWDNIVCVARQEICPLCNSGDKPSFVGVFTVLNETPYTIKTGPNAGKVLEARRELYVATANTLQVLQHHAAKRGGLRGWKVEIARLTDKEARVGSTFQWLSRRSPEEIAALGENGTPADYGHELKYMSAAEMVKAGFGKAASGPGFGQSSIADASDQM